MGRQGDRQEIVEKYHDKHATKTEIARLEKAALPKPLVEKFKEVREAGNC